MAKFGTEEWVQEMVAALNNSENYEKAAKWWEGDMLFIVRADGPIKEDIYFWLDLQHGKALSGRKLQSPDEVNPAFVYEGAYTKWKKVAEREINPIRGLLAGDFKLKGDMSVVLKAVSAADEIVNCIIGIGTDFD